LVCRKKTERSKEANNIAIQNSLNRNKAMKLTSMRVGVYPTLPADINDGWLTLNTSELSLLSIELSAV